MSNNSKTVPEFRACTVSLEVCRYALRSSALFCPSSLHKCRTPEHVELGLIQQVSGVSTHRVQNSYSLDLAVSVRVTQTGYDIAMPKNCSVP